MDKILEFVNYINSFIDEDFCEEIRGVCDNYDGEEKLSTAFFTNGGCKDFATLLKRYIPSVKYCLSTKEQHVVAKIGEHCYDTTGVLSEERLVEGEFSEITDEDAEILNERFGFGKTIYLPGLSYYNEETGQREYPWYPYMEVLIKEIDTVLTQSNGQYIKQLLSDINAECNKENSSELKAGVK